MYCGKITLSHTGLFIYEWPLLRFVENVPLIFDLVILDCYEFLWSNEMVSPYERNGILFDSFVRGTH